MLKNRKYLKLLKFIYPFILIFFIYLESKNELKDFDPSLLLINLQNLSFFQIALLFFIGIITFSTMLLYDVLLVNKLQLKIKAWPLLKISWISNTFNNVMGFGGVTGASLRGVFYKKYSDQTKELITSVLWVTPFMLTGLSVLAMIPLFSGIKLGPIFTELPWMKLGLIGCACFLPIYSILLLTDIKKKRVAKWNQWMTYAILTSLLEWSAAATFLWGITVITGYNLPFTTVLPIFIAAAIAGAISLVPGGFGSFDLIILLGFQFVGLEDSQVFLILLFYRLFYYIIPFILGLILASTEVVGQSKNFFTSSKFGTFVKKYKLIPEHLIPNLSHWALAALVFISGVLLLLSAATPSTLERVRIAEKLLTLPILNFSYQLSITAGISLLLLSRNIQLKVKSAYKLTYFLLFAGAILTFSKGFDFEEALFLLGIAALLRISKKKFNRETFSLSWNAFITMGALTMGSIISYVLIGYFDQPYENIRIPHRLKEFLIRDPDELLISAVIGLFLAILFNYFGLRVLSKKKTDDMNLEGLKEFFEKYNGNVLTHLIYLKDKTFYWAQNREVLFMYATIGDKMVVLGDPVGNPSKFKRGIHEFQTFAIEGGFIPVFYQIEKEHLTLYLENGYQFFKLGEEAYVNLEEFTLTGKKKAPLRNVKNKFEREGYTFRVVTPPFSNELMNEWKEISDEWLGKRKEKGFSLGFFNDFYIQQSPVAILSDNNRTTVAFATLMPVYDNGQTLSIDLMRYKKEAPNGTMDFLFISLFEYAKQNGYTRFNLGMAPLSNVGTTKYAFLDEKIASKVYQHGYNIYQFDGIRKYKEKFATSWEPKYLAIRGRTSLPYTMIQLSLLIGKRRK